MISVVVSDKRYRAQTDLSDSPESRAALAPKLRKLNESIKRGQFTFEAFFPELAPASLQPKPAPAPAALVATAMTPVAAAAIPGPNFGVFAEQWLGEFKVGWRKTYITTVRGILDQHLLPRFGDGPGHLRVLLTIRFGRPELRLAFAADNPRSR